jgi:hypothetical protein
MALKHGQLTKDISLNWKKIKWQDKKTNFSVLEQAAVPCVESIIVSKAAKVEWLCKRNPGGQQKRFKDCLKTNLTQCEINVENWDNLAEDRDVWRKAIRDGLKRF